MNKKLKTALIILITAVLTCALCLGIIKKEPSGSGTAEFKGTATKTHNITILNLSGTWFEMGRQYGALAKGQLQDVFAFCNDMIEKKEGNSEKAISIVGTQVEQMPYTIREFFRGAAETSGLSVDQLYVTNAVERIAGLPQCSMVAVWGDYAEDKMVIGRNYDYGDTFSKLKNDVLVTVFNPSDGALSTAIVGYAGEIYAVNGMNEAGIFLELNNGKPSAPMSSPDERITGTTLLLDLLFEADSLELVDRYFNTMLCSSSYIINVLDGTRARSYEWCPIGVKHGEDDNPEGMLVSTNHYVDPDWEMEPPTDENSWESFTRRNNLIDLCESMKGGIDAEDMKKIITTSIEDGGSENELTVYQIVAEPADRVLWVKTVESDQWAEVDLKDYWKH